MCSESVSYTHLDVYKRQPTGRQNKTIKRQVSLAVTSNNETLPMIFLIAHGLPFDILIGCDILRKYSAVIDMRRARVSMKSENIEWIAELIGRKGVVTVNNIYNIRTVTNSQDNIFEERTEDQSSNDSLWNKKLEEIRLFQGEQNGNSLTTQQVENLISIYNKYRHVFSDLSLIHI